MKEILSVIPARAHSKGIINKNIFKIREKPLMAYSIECSLNSKYVSRTVVTTDSLSYKKIAESYGAEVPFIREKKFSTGDVHAVIPVIDTLIKLSKQESYNPDLVIMLLPTSPLRKSITLDRAIEKFKNLKSEFKSLVSVKSLNKSKHHLRKIKGDLLLPFEEEENYNIQRQGLENLFVLNGSIYIASPTDLLKYKSFHIDNQTTFFEMNEFESIDIDNMEDITNFEKLI